VEVEKGLLMERELAKHQSIPGDKENLSRKLMLGKLLK